MTPGAGTALQKCEVPWRYLPKRNAAGLIRVPGPGVFAWNSSWHALTALTRIDHRQE